MKTLSYTSESQNEDLSQAGEDDEAKALSPIQVSAKVAHLTLCLLHVAVRVAVDTVSLTWFVFIVVNCATMHCNVL